MKDEKQDYKHIVKNAVLDEDTFARLTLGKKLREDHTDWVKVVVRPVLIRGRRIMQFSYYDPKKDTTKNYAGDEIARRLDEVLAVPFGTMHVQSTAGDISVRVTRKGRVLVARSKPSRAEARPDLSHDRVKSRLLPPESSAAFLHAVGVTDKRGKVRPSMAAKYHQIEEFLRIIRQTVPGIARPGEPVRIVDCGCGSAYLTFAAYHYLTAECGLEVSVVGIDVNEELVERAAGLRDSLGWKGLEFRVSRIADYAPETPPDVVLSLHACDTATDEAIAQGVLWGSSVILAAPCCQHELHNQLDAPLFRPVLRQGILKERLADILTDTFRALALRIMGYNAGVVEFVSSEHTSKNLMIRAERGPKPGHAASVREYRDLREFWGVSPAIERMLGEDFLGFLGQDV